ELVLTCLDIGHGQAAVLQMPGHCFIFDAGSQYNRDIGRRVVGPFLRHEGTDSIDAIIISHDDIDHINGIPEIVADNKIKAVYTTRAFAKKAEDYGAARYLNYCLNNENIKIELLPEKLETTDDAAIKILWPDVNASLNDSLSDNDKSVVSLIEYAGRRILICSDIESYAQQKLFERFESLSADVVIAPHHGSLSTMSENFLERLGAEYVICSCGQRQYLKLQRAPKYRGNWFYTPKHGAISVRIDNKGRIDINEFIKE
ncbi:MAG: MBL fold metallo-hydrolase, partial [Phycisphaerales bacterium]